MAAVVSLIIVVGFLLTAFALLATGSVGLFKPRAISLNTRGEVQHVMAVAVVLLCIGFFMASLVGTRTEPAVAVTRKVMDVEPAAPAVPDADRAAFEERRRALAAFYEENERYKRDMPALLQRYDDAVNAGDWDRAESVHAEAVAFFSAAVERGAILLDDTRALARDARRLGMLDEAQTLEQAIEQDETALKLMREQLRDLRQSYDELTR